MPAFLLPLLAKIIPYALGLIAIVAGYFTIKHKGAVAEREKIQAQQTAAIEARKVEVARAVQKDRTVDKTVGEKIDAIKKPQPAAEKPAEDYKPGDIFKF